MAANIFLLVLVASICGLSQGVDVKVSVYYESLCGDSIRFITGQFWPTYKKIGSPIKVDLVPYGKASESNASGHWEFTCQHGPDECFGNAYQACAIALFSIEESAEFVECAMSSDNPSSEINLRQCAASVGVAWSSLQTCYQSGQADKLLLENGERTRAVTPKINFVPTVILDDVYTKENEDRALSNFQSLVCDALNQQPDACKEDIEVVVIH